MNEANIAKTTPSNRGGRRQSTEISTSASEPLAPAQVELRVGQIVHYTELVTGNRPQDGGRREKPRIRAAVVVFVLDDGQDRRPVLRVLNPMAPPMTSMPAEGVVHAGVALADHEVYGPKYDPDPSAQNTWRPVS